MLTVHRTVAGHAGIVPQKEPVASGSWLGFVPIDDHKPGALSLLELTLYFGSLHLYDMYGGQSSFLLVAVNGIMSLGSALKQRTHDA